MSEIVIVRAYDEETPWSDPNKINPMSERRGLKVSVWTISYEDDGVHADAILENGKAVLHLNPGTERNEANAGTIVELLNQREEMLLVMAELKRCLIESADRIAFLTRQLDAAYSQNEYLKSQLLAKQ